MDEISEADQLEFCDREKSQLLETNYWVSGGPEFESVLNIIPPCTSEAEGEDKCSSPPVELEIFDADGASANKVKVSLSSREVIGIELSNLMGACKLESGIVHGRLSVRAPVGVEHSCMLNSDGGISVSRELQMVSGKEGAFFPVTFSADRESHLCLVNFSNEPQELKVKLFLGNRGPVASSYIPAGGSRILNLTAEFLDVNAIRTKGQQLQGYIRLIQKVSEAEFGVQLIEMSSSGKSRNLIRMVG